MASRAWGKSSRELLLGLAVICMGLALLWTVPVTAHAEDISTLQSQVEQTAEEYSDAVAEVESLNKQIEENKAAIEDIEKQLPGMRERSMDSSRTLYLLHRDRAVLYEILLTSGSLSDFFQTFEYFDSINTHYTSELERLSSTEAELVERQDQLDADMEKAKEEMDRADKALKEAQEARQQAEAEAVAAAQRQADGEASMLAQKEAQEKLKAERSGINAANGSSEAAGYNEVQDYSGTIAAGEVNWSASKTEFVNEWSVRIDAYLAGSPLAGQGVTFASAAWDNGVDPRWSPAISCVESTKGTYCFMPCNAWGWGNYSFGSWEEAITGHVAYLGNMYGSTITPQAASIYCPPNASFWYNRCIEEMSMI